MVVVFHLTVGSQIRSIKYHEGCDLSLSVSRGPASHPDGQVRSTEPCTTLAVVIPIRADHVQSIPSNSCPEHSTTPPAPRSRVWQVCATVTTICSRPRTVNPSCWKGCGAYSGIRTPERRPSFCQKSIISYCSRSCLTDQTRG